jgi:hypothetical protein
MSQPIEQSGDDAHLKQKIRNITDPTDPAKRKAADELVETLGGAHDSLFRATTVFPLTLFPDTISVDRSQISITHRNFLWSGEVISISIEDILNIAALVGPFFGKIEITTRFFGPDKPYEIDHLWRKDALRLKRIVQGYLVTHQKDIDTSALSDEELSKTLDELGKVSPDEKVNLV